MNDRAEALQLLQQGNFRDALAIYNRLLEQPDQKEEDQVEDFRNAMNCYQQLQQLGEIDRWREQLLETHPQRWLLHAEIARSFFDNDHYGFVTAGEFNRGAARGSGQWSSCLERDRVRGLQILGQSLRLAEKEASPQQLAEIYFLWARGIKLGREGGESWRLQATTDLDVLPDVEVAERWGGRGRGGWGWPGPTTKGAPVDAQGQPIFYSLAESQELARNDGERARWAEEQSAKLNPSAYRDLVDLERAGFLMSQFGVQTIANYAGLFRGLEEDQPSTADNPFAVSRLSENETIARLATGVKRFALPDEFNHIKLFQELAQRSAPQTRRNALQQLGTIFENRQQFPRAAGYFQQLIDAGLSDEQTQPRLDQILKPWGMFETALTQAAGKGASVEFRFRNATKVEFVARPIDLDQLLNDTRDYLKKQPENVDWSMVNLDGIAYSILQDDWKKYLGEQVADWGVELQPRPNHFDRRITIQTPLQKSGAYLLTAKVGDGNECSVVIWVADTAIARKPINDGWLYMIADAVDGQPVAGCNVEFFGWRSQWDQARQKSVTTFKNFAEQADKDGFVQPASRLLDPQYQWVAVARNAEGRLAFTGFNSVWAGSYSESRYAVTRAYGVTDRPIYRPSQTVNYKIWIRQVGYEEDLKQPYLNHPIRILIYDPQGTEIVNEMTTTDQWGSVKGEISLSADAALGNYVVNISDPNRRKFSETPIRFRVEEYKKPEYEVLVEAPTTPLPLGEKIPVTIRANYYFGGAVTDAVVKYKVERTTKSQRWYPIGPWDWLYGNGYSWLGNDYDWYPGFARWGCYRPIPPWWNFNPDPPELVLEEEGRIDENGTLLFEIDTALAKAMHGDQDHQYSITAEVVDASRRTIVGSGSVTVSHRPFKVYVWASRGYVRAGEFVDIQAQARSADGVGVPGTGTMVLYQVRYDQDGVPKETELQSWPIQTDEGGSVVQRIKATESGQFRIALKLTDAKGQSEEGGQLLHVVGTQFDSANFKYSDLEVLVEKTEYAPGEKLRLLLQSNQSNARLLVWARPSSAYAGPPQVVALDGKSGTIELDVTQADMPNFFVEVMTIFDARVHEVTREIFVPPASKIVNMEITPAADKVLPGENTTVQVKLTDPQGKPFTDPIVMTVYDRALEYISGGSNVEDIRTHFWSWKRSHFPRTEHTLGRVGSNLVRSFEQQMGFIGVFGNLSADTPEEMIRDGMPGGGGLMLKSRGGDAVGAVAAPMMAEAAADMAGLTITGEANRGRFNGAQDGEAPQNEMVQPVVRTEFADTAYWNVQLEPNAEGMATATIKMPENLTAWKIRAWAIGLDTSVGEATAEMATAKNIMVRMQAPRFFVEKDQVVLSALVHNYLDVSKAVAVAIELDGELLSTETPATQTIEIEAGGLARVNWLVKVLREGTAQITMSAKTDVESDAMRVDYPVLVHGMLKTESFSNIVRAGEQSTTFEIRVPEERRPELSRLEIRYSPTLAGAMVDALPYLNEYPYGCTEQTLNRFLPTLITLRTIERLGVDLARIRDKRTNLNPQEIGDDQERMRRWQFLNNPVFDIEEVMLMAKVGLADLTKMQNSDGGWGWFSGRGERSWPHTTATVVRGLLLAKANDLGMVPNVLENGVAWLERYQKEQLEQLREGDRRKDLPPNQPAGNKVSRQSADNLDALVYLTLAEAGIVNAEMADYLFRDRANLSLYGKGLVGLAFDLQQDNARRDMLIQNIDQFVKYDAENQSAFIDLPNQNYWWYWYGDSIEANAIYLKLLSKVKPNDRVTAGLVKYLINNRRHGSYWKSTRDTALCVEAFADFIQATGEDQRQITVEVLIDGVIVKQVEISPDNLFTFDNKFVLEGVELSTGVHQVEIRRSGEGNLYTNAYLTNFTLEDSIEATGLEIKVDRKFYRLEPIADAQTQVAGDRGQVIDQKVEKFRRVPLTSWDQVRSGDLIEIELAIESKNDYEYVIFEDMKAAGCEAVELRSGYVPGSLNAYVEFRDQRVAFFTRMLNRGKHSFSYRVRAEIPGQFSALPTKAWAMYAPELRANSDEMKLKIEDRDDLK